MVDFIEKLRLKGKAEEDLYFAKQDRKLIDAMHEKQMHDDTETSHDTCETLIPENAAK